MNLFSIIGNRFIYWLCVQRKVHGMINNMSDLSDDSRDEQEAGVWEEWWVGVGVGTSITVN